MPTESYQCHALLLLVRHLNYLTVVVNNVVMLRYLYNYFYWYNRPIVEMLFSSVLLLSAWLGRNCEEMSQSKSFFFY